MVVSLTTVRDDKLVAFFLATLPLAATLSAAALSFVGLTISKEQKLSEFRRQWIEDLRTDLAIITGKLTHFMLKARALTGLQDQPDGLWRMVQPEIVAFDEAASRIILRLNSEEEAAQNVLATMWKLQQEIFRRSKQLNDEAVDELDELRDRFLLESRILLKAEWVRVKKGEPFFARARLAGVISAVVFFALIIAWVVVAFVLLLRHPQ